jgi:hypothetical protein
MDYTYLFTTGIAVFSEAPTHEDASGNKSIYLSILYLSIRGK